jgi:hypothetical protein
MEKSLILGFFQLEKLLEKCWKNQPNTPPRDNPRTTGPIHNTTAATVDTLMAENREWLIWSDEHQPWWVRRFGGNWGYTPDIAEAGHYTEADLQTFWELGVGTKPEFVSLRV